MERLTLISIKQFQSNGGGKSPTIHSNKETWQHSAQQMRMTI